MQDSQQAVERLIVKSTSHQMRGEYRQGYLCIKEALNLIERVSVADNIRWRALLQSARCAYYLSRLNESIDQLSKLETLLEDIEIETKQWALWESSIIRANIFRRFGKFDEALKTLDGFGADFIESCPFRVTVEKLLIEGACYFYLDNVAKAQETLETALGFATHYSDSRSRSRVLTTLGLLAQSNGFIKVAKDYFIRSKDLCRVESDCYGEAAAALNLGIAFYRQGEFARAENIISKSKSIFEKIEWKLGVCRCLLALGNIKKYRRDFTGALRLYRDAERIADRNGFSRERALTFEFLGEVYYERGDYESAECFYRDSLKLAEMVALGADVVVEVYRRMGDLYIAQGEIKSALSHFQKGLDLSKRLRDRMEEGLILRGIGEALFSLDERDSWGEQFKKTIDILRLAGCNFELAKTHLRYAELLLGEDAVSDVEKVNGNNLDDDTRDEAWRSLIEAGHLLSGMDVPFYSEKVDNFIDRVIVERKTRHHIERSFNDQGHVIKVEFSPEFIIHDRFVAVSQPMLEVWRQVQFAASFTRPILITGETGTGKELIAGLIHLLSDRAKRPFVAVNCAAVPDHLFESEFFGHQKGCFTGASSDRMGIFEEANGGTLFLDEIGELTTLQQVKLLRVLQECRIRRIGENKERPIDVRIISATNRVIEKMVESSNIRADFLYRINAEQIHLPTLRERPEDIVPLLAYYFSGNGGGESGVVEVETIALKCLQSYSWPGNVREFFSVLERAKHISPGGIITVDMLPERIGGDSCRSERITSCHQGCSDADREKIKLEKALLHCNGNKTAAARWLGVSRGTFYKGLKRTGLEHLIRNRPAC